MGTPALTGDQVVLVKGPSTKTIVFAPPVPALMNVGGLSVILENVPVDALGTTLQGVGVADKTNVAKVTGQSLLFIGSLVQDAADPGFQGTITQNVTPATAVDLQ